ncbi:MAG: glycosyltransferase [Desulfobulbaceae bacterium]|nr:glycosyltransferase [Desulfobulbaceae bacterium]
MEPDLSICVLAAGKPEHSRRFLASVFENADHVSLDVIVLVDFIDGDFDLLSREFPEARVCECGGQKNVCDKINKVLPQTTGRYVSFWDHESVVTSHCLTRLVEFLDDVPEAGIAGPKIRSEKGTIQHVARCFPSFLSLLACGRNLPGKDMAGWSEYAGGETDWFAGSGMTVSRYLLGDIGGLNRSFSLFWPIEFCLRARKAGWHVHYLQDAQIVGSLAGWRKIMMPGMHFFPLRLWEALLLKLKSFGR